MSKPQLADIVGIGPSTAKILENRGFSDVQKIASASVENLAQVPGFGPVRAVTVITAAQSLLLAAKASPQAAKPGKKKKDKKKKGDKKKDKRKKKKKKKDGKKKRKNKKSDKKKRKKK
jgi:NAD-dependent DNA ligase